MKENTKKYLKDLINYASIEANTLEFALSDIQKTLKKLRKFCNRVVEKL
jgi:hypothetical protein